MSQKPVADQPKFTGTMNGPIRVHLNLNKFRVELSDGMVVDAVMTDELIEKVRPWYEDRTKGLALIDVRVRFRPPPAMPLIVEFNNPRWGGEARAKHR